MKKYIYNPHKHVKIWISNNPDLFMNMENRVRLIEMREKNPNDEISLVYDSSLLKATAIAELKRFCEENEVTYLDANSFPTILITDEERELFKLYKNELNNIDKGGNLAVASDILRWLSPVFAQGTYADFDYPIDTNDLPNLIEVESPLLLNIGSLKMGHQEFILSNNDYVAVADPKAAHEHIQKVQCGLIAKLKYYETDFVEKTETQLNKSFINRCLLKFMKNRSESIYISKSKEIHYGSMTSLEIRGFIKKVMSDKIAFLDFNRETKVDTSVPPKILAVETDQQILARLRSSLKSQLTLMKYLFFYNEYDEMRQILAQNNDDVLLEYLMKMELNLYFKSIVVCTTGPIQISNSLFGGYVVNSKIFKENIQPISFNHYGLQKAFQSKNSIPLHENVLGMLHFLGLGDGVVNDSSWLESGRKLQEKRAQTLVQRQQELEKTLPNSLMTLKKTIQKQIANLANATPHEKQKKEVLEKILDCFHEHRNKQEFDINQFRKQLSTIYANNQLVNHQTQKLVQELEHLAHEAVVLSLTNNRKIQWAANDNVHHERISA